MKTNPRKQILTFGGETPKVVHSGCFVMEELFARRMTHVHRSFIREILHYAADPKVRAIVLDAPKLFEVGLNQLCDTVVFVDAEWSVRVRRAAESRGWSEVELARRENLQSPLDGKKANADHIVINHSGIDELRSQVERVFASVLASFA